MDIFSKGDLVRWIVGHSTFAAYHDRLVGEDPIYKYGIIMQVSPVNSHAIVVHSYGDTSNARLIILDGEDDMVEILSKGAPRNG